MRRLLTAAGFNDTRFYAALPHCRSIRYMVPFDSAHAFGHFLRMLTPSGTGRTSRTQRILRGLAPLLARLRLHHMAFVRYLCPSYIVVCRKQEGPH